MCGFQAAVQLAVDRMALYKEDADSANKLTKDKGGRKKKALIMRGDYRGQDTHSQHFQLSKNVPPTRIIENTPGPEKYLILGGDIY